jgi:putative hydrolase of the HAD superfamily
MPDQPVVEAVVFDLGGVLLEVGFETVFASWAADAGTTAAFIRERFHFDAAYEQHERGEINASQYFAALRRSLNLDLTEEQFRSGWNQCVRGEIPGVAALVSAFGDRLPIYVFSNTNAAHYTDWGPRYQHLMRPFRRLFMSHEMGMRKPEARAFEFIASEIGVDLPKILFFDDTTENVTGARAVGMLAVHVRDIEDIRSTLAGLRSG